MEAALFISFDMASYIFKEIGDIIVKAQPQGLEIFKIFKLQIILPEYQFHNVHLEFRI
jgi:hypothetical protein